MYKILVIEDNDSDAAIIKFLLNQYGYEFDIAKDPFDADEKLHTKTYHLILLDWQLPRMSGIDYLKKLKRNPNKKDIPVVMMSGRNEVHNIKLAQKEGISAYIVKPVEPSNLKSKISELLFRKEKENIAIVPENFHQKNGSICNPLQIKGILNEEIVFETSCYLKIDETYDLSFDLFKELNIQHFQSKITKSQLDVTSGQFTYTAKLLNQTDDLMQKIVLLGKTFRSMEHNHV